MARRPKTPTPKRRAPRSALVQHMRTEEDALAALSKRVQQVEGDVSVLKSQMDLFREDVASLRTQLRQIDERTIRGERLMLEVQLEQRRASRVLEAIAEKLNVPPLTLTPIPFKE